MNFKRSFERRSRSRKSVFYGISWTIVLLGLASFFADASSEMITPILPLFLTSLGGTGVIIGLIGGLGDSVASLFRIFSGYYSDRIGKRKPFVIAGYSFSAFAKLFMAFATAPWHILVLRPIERIGKGTREPPRDALTAAIAQKRIRGKIFATIKAMDTFGAIIGSVLVLIFLYYIGLSFKTIFIISGLIAFLSSVALYFIKDVKTKPLRKGLISGIRDLPKDFRTYLFIATIFAIADFSYMFFILKSSDYFSSYLIPVALYVIFNLVYAVFTFPIGIWSDKVGRKKVLTYGYFLFIISCVLFIFAKSLLSFVLCFSIYGLAYAFIVSNERAFASDLANRKELGTSMGTFHMFIALAALPASLIAGYLWQYSSHNAPFIFGAIAAFIAMTMFIFSKNLDKK